MSRKSTWFRSASVATLVVASTIVTTRIAAATQFFVNQTIDGGSVAGTITTDGFTGLQFTSDITAFDLTTSVGGQTSTLIDTAHGGSGSVFVSTGSLSVTPDGTQLQFNFGGSGVFTNFFTPPATAAGCAPFWTMRTGGGNLCGLVSGTVNSVGAVPGGAIATADMTGTGIQTIGTTTPPPPPPEIPLPPALYLFGTALGGAFWMSRRKRGAVSSLGTA